MSVMPFSTDGVESLDLMDTHPDLQGWKGGFHDGTHGYVVPYWFERGHPRKVARFALQNFQSESVQILDLTDTHPDLNGFWGGFHDGTYGYLVPLTDANLHGTVARFELNSFGSVQTLDLTIADQDLRGFHGGFQDGTYGYVVPHANYRDSNRNFGKIARFELQNFVTDSVQTLDLATTDPELMGFEGGFHDGTYGYVVPVWSTPAGGYFGKIARFELQSFLSESVEVLDLTIVDQDLRGFWGGFQDGTYGYAVPYINSAGAFGKIARFELQNFVIDSVQTLDLATTDLALKGFRGGFHDGTYGYLVPAHPGAISGKIARFELNSFGSVETLDLTTTDPHLKGFDGGFHDGTYGYVLPDQNSNISPTRFGTIARFLAPQAKPITSPTTSSSSSMTTSPTTTSSTMTVNTCSTQAACIQEMFTITQGDCPSRGPCRWKVCANFVYDTETGGTCPEEWLKESCVKNECKPQEGFPDFWNIASDTAMVQQCQEGGPGDILEFNFAGDGDCNGDGYDIVDDIDIVHARPTGSVSERRLKKKNKKDKKDKKDKDIPNVCGGRAQTVAIACHPAFDNDTVCAGSTYKPCVWRVSLPARCGCPPATASDGGHAQSRLVETLGRKLPLGEAGSTAAITGLVIMAAALLAAAVATVFTSRRFHATRLIEVCPEE